MNTITIELLKDHVDLVPVLAVWDMTEWHRYHLNVITREMFTRMWQTHANNDHLPLTFVALNYDLPVGMVSLVDCDLSTHKHLTPWLASLYVIPEYRGNGIGTLLHDRILDMAYVLGYEEVFLHTHQAAEMYRRLGWKYLDTVPIPGEHRGELFRKELV